MIIKRGRVHDYITNQILDLLCMLGVHQFQLPDEDPQLPEGPVSFVGLVSRVTLVIVNNLDLEIASPHLQRGHGKLSLAMKVIETFIIGINVTDQTPIKLDRDVLKLTPVVAHVTDPPCYG